MQAVTTLRAACTLALALAGSQAMAGTNIRMNCDMESDYAVDLTERSVILTRDDGTPRTVLMRGGRLFIDDRWVTVTPADSQRIAAYEAEARAMLPLAHRVASDAVDVAFIAIGEVATGLSNNPVQTREKLAKARRTLDVRMAKAVDARHFDSKAFGDSIGQGVGEMVPMVIGDIAGGAISAAMSGDTARFERLQNMEKDIDARIGTRSKSLEANANAMCVAMRRLDAIDNALDYRLPGGARLDLLEVRDDARSGHRNKQQDAPGDAPPAGASSRA